MKVLKQMMEENGFTCVKTYINSGNLIFEAPKQDLLSLRTRIETLLETTFHLSLKIVLRTDAEIAAVAAQVPASWNTDTDIRCYVAFVREPVTVSQVTSAIVPKEGIDQLDAGPQVVYMTTKVAGLTRSGLNKIASTKVYHDVTIRNYNTLRKIQSLMK